MIPSRIIRIFLASSIIELKEERDKLCQYLAGADIQNMFLHDKVIIQLVRSEDIGFGTEGENPQEILNQRLRECDISLFLFKTKAGKRTREEFEVAKALQKEKRHTVCVYCMDILDTQRSGNLKRIIKRLDKEGPDWNTFESVGDVKALFIKGLLSYEFKLLVKLGERYETSVESTQFWTSMERTEMEGGEWFKQYEFHKLHQNRSKKEVHKALEELVSQVGTIMDDKSKPIADRIFRSREVYEKAVFWASRTDYDKKKYCNLLFDYAKFVFQSGQYFDAEKIFLHQIAITEELNGIENKETATSYNSIGSVYWWKGDTSKALEYYKKSLAIREKILGTDHPDTAASYSGIGLALWKYGDYSQALEFLDKALNIRKKTLGEDHPDTAESYSNIGMIYRREGNYKLALDFHSKALEIRKKALGLNHQDTAESYNNLGAVCYYQGNYSGALEYHKEALKIDEKTLGTNHPSTAIDYNNIGKNYRELGDYNHALEFLKKALEIDEIFLGTDNPDTAVDYNNIGVLCFKTEQYERAMEFLEKALRIRTEKLAVKHPDTLETKKWIELTKTAMNGSDENNENNDGKP